MPPDRPADPPHPADAASPADAVYPARPAGPGAGDEAHDLLVCYVPEGSTEAVLQAAFEAGAGVIGEYQHCAHVTRGTGRFRPIGDARPVIGQLGRLEMVVEERVEVVLPRRLRAAVVDAVWQAHPYEEPVVHVLAGEAILTRPRG